MVMSFAFVSKADENEALFGVRLMRTLIKLALPLFALLLLAGIYVIKVETWQLKREAKTLERQIETEQRAIILLRAEWAFLTRPERIEKLAREHLKMRPARPEQIIVLGR